MRHRDSRRQLDSGAVGFDPNGWQQVVNDLGTPHVVPDPNLAAVPPHHAQHFAAVAGMRFVANAPVAFEPGLGVAVKEPPGDLGPFEALVPRPLAIRGLARAKREPQEG